METKNQALQDFIIEHEVDLDLFYSVRFDKDVVYLQGCTSTKALLIFKNLGNLRIDDSGCLQLNFIYNETKFDLYLS